MKKLLSLLFAVVFVLSSAGSAAAADGIYDISLSSNGAYLVNLDLDTVIFEKNADVRMYPASLTKLVTALVVLTDCSDLSEEVTVPSISYFADVYEEKGSNIALKPGEVLTVEQLLYALILPSACDAATALAYHFGDGDTQKFYDRMNELAADAGATDSHFMNAHGLHEDEHYSTPRDIAMVAKKLLSIDEFNTIINTTNYVIPATNMSDERRIKYTIEMLFASNPNYYEYMHGIKSGYTSLAGRCLSSTAEKDGVHYLLVLMGANLGESTEQNLAYTDTRKLYEYAFSSYERKDIITAGKPVTSIKVDGGEIEKIDLISDKTLTAMVDKNDEITYEYNLPDSLSAPFGSETVGSVTVKCGGRDISTLRLYPATEEVVAAMAETAATESSEKLVDLAKDKWFDILLIVLASLVVFIVLFIAVARAYHKKQRKKCRPKRYVK